MAKVTVASQWLESCAGCHMSFLDIDERIVELLQHVELSSTPITDLKHPPEEGVTVGILSGGIGNEEQIEEAKIMRERCEILIAMGRLCRERRYLLHAQFLQQRRSFTAWIR